CGGASFVHTIHDPDSLGNASNFEQRAIYIGDFYPPKPSHIDSYLVATLPNMPNYNLDPLPIYAASAGEDTMICVGDTALLGSPQVDKIIYQWSPSEGLSDQTIAQPFASPDKTTTYYLTIIDTTENRNYSCINRNVSVTVTVDENCSGLHEISSFYPNPSDRNGISMDYILKTDETGELVIYNILGIQTNAYSLEPGRHTLTISNSTWSTGMYIYKLFINGQLEEQGKLVVGK
ncbi:MAG: T9SS type A sorting domain-containing protein, partial [Bacteroidetes bacterium]|nr:T9SS type A sorting domain-containing protein [Bacteroidota bacterium]